MYAVVNATQVDRRRPNLGEILHITKDEEGNVVMCPVNSTPEKCVVFLRPGDEFRLDFIPECLMEQFRIGTSVKVCCVEGDRLKFISDLAAPSIALARFADCNIPIEATTLRVAPSVLDQYPDQEQLDFDY
ncbi:MAG: hypothetical protein KBC35_00085 [Candidatus Pacebacteria bacterium]|nr:hypothetical protein [Candidatus Paceibacterota bacterium]